MKNMLYMISCILIVFWAIGFLVFKAGEVIHILFILAVIAVAIRVFLFQDKATDINTSQNNENAIFRSNANELLRQRVIREKSTDGIGIYFLMDKGRFILRDVYHKKTHRLYEEQELIDAIKNQKMPD